MDEKKAQPDPVGWVRTAPAYPAFLRAGRVYAAGYALMLTPAVLVMVLALGSAVLLVSLLGLLVAIAGGFMARSGFQRLEQELAPERHTEVRSAATIAAFQDLLRRRAGGRRRR